MPDILTALGEFRLDDEVALEHWLFAHDLRHIAYSKRFRLPGGTLRGPVNGDWMLRHSLQHAALAKAAGDKRANPATLAIPGKWRTDQELADWHLPHRQMHQQIEGVMAHGS